MVGIANKAVSSLGERLSEKQKELHLTDVSVADALGVSKVAVGKWRRGESEPNSTNLEKLADVLKTTVEYLQYGSDKDGKCKKVPYYELLDFEHRDGETGIIQRPVDDRFVFVNSDIATSAGADINNSFAYLIDDNAMADKIDIDSICIADMSKKEVRSGKIYCFRYGLVRRTRYLHRLPCGGLLVKSHNADIAADEIIPIEDLNKIEIYGWVWCWSGHEVW